MWAALQHPGHVEFYEEFQRGRHERDEDWEPMIRAVQYLQAQPYAVQLFAFTSLADFHVTTAPSYEDFQGHRTVGITWMFRDRTFRLSLGESWSGRRQNERTCEERYFPSSVDSLVQGLLIQDESRDAWPWAAANPPIASTLQSARPADRVAELDRYPARGTQMGILSDFFLADKTATPDYDCGPDFPAKDRCQFKSITPLEAAGILSVLRGGGDRIEMLGAFPLLTPEEAEEWTMSVPEDMTIALAALQDSQIPDVAHKCADATAEELGWSSDDFHNVLTQLCALARRAADTNKSMYLWNSL